MKEKRIGYFAAQYDREYIKSGYPDALSDLIKEFSIKAKEISEPAWYEKRAKLYYSYNEKSYAITPEILDCSGEALSMLSNEMIDRMYELGAYDMYYAGQID